LFVDELQLKIVVRHKLIELPSLGLASSFKLVAVIKMQDNCVRLKIGEVVAVSSGDLYLP